MIIWTDYMNYRLQLRGFDYNEVEKVIKYTPERYFDTSTGRQIAVGNHKKLLVMIPYEQNGSDITPVTIHATSRHQINLRLKSGRYKNE
ncbi:MAG: hypothetical protein U9N53_13165 [Bacteroidota bacterium]|nr:hypothetical protein [Bacteroidota bacterium]